MRSERDFARGLPKISRYPLFVQRGLGRLRDLLTVGDLACVKMRKVNFFYGVAEGSVVGKGFVAEVEDDGVSGFEPRGVNAYNFGARGLLSDRVVEKG